MIFFFRPRPSGRVLALLLSATLLSCGGDKKDEELVLTIGADGEIVEADQVDELAPFDPTLQQLIFHLNLKQAEEFVSRFPNATIFDIRSSDQYAGGHLPGSNHVDWLADRELFQLFVGQLPREDKCLIYGSTAMLQDTAAAIALLRGIGFQNIYTFQDSYDAWQSAGLPFEQGTDPNPLPLPLPPEEVEGAGEEDLSAQWAVWRRAEQQVNLRQAAEGQ